MYRITLKEKSLLFNSIVDAMEKADKLTKGSAVVRVFTRNGTEKYVGQRKRFVKSRCYKSMSRLSRI